MDRSLTMYNANHLGMAYRVPTPKHGLSPRQARELTWDKREWYRRRVSPEWVADDWNPHRGPTPP